MQVGVLSFPRSQAASMWRLACLAIPIPIRTAVAGQVCAQRLISLALNRQIDRQKNHPVGSGFGHLIAYTKACGVTPRGRRQRSGCAARRTRQLALKQNALAAAFFTRLAWRCLRSSANEGVAVLAGASCVLTRERWHDLQSTLSVSEVLLRLLPLRPQATESLLVE